VAFETRIARRVSLAVERQATSAWIRRGGRARLRGVPAWAIMALLGVIALSPIVASALPPSGTVVVSTAQMAGWTVQLDTSTPNPPTAATAFVAGPDVAPSGAGSVLLGVGSDGDGGVQLRNPGYVGTLLSDVTVLSYSTYVSVYMGCQAPYIILSLDYTGDGVVDDALFFEPCYQSGTYGGDPIPAQGVPVLNTWQTWNALEGGWWAFNAFTFGPPLTTISSYIGSHPETRIVHSLSGAGGVRIAAGYGAGAWDNFVGNVDSFTIGVGAAVTTFDFEPSPGPAHLDIGSNGVYDFDFPTMQGAVNAANSGDTVLVDAGTYPELVVVMKTMTLLGAQHGHPGFARGAGGESVVGTPDGAFQILSDNVVIDGFTITGVDSSLGTGLGAGIHTTGTYSGYEIRNNIITGNTMGLYLNSDGASPTVVEDNLFDSNNAGGAASGNAIYSDQGANDIAIADNRFTDHLNTAMLFVGSPPSFSQSDITVSGNVFESGDAGSVAFMFTTGITIQGNSWTGSLGSSLFLGGGVHDVLITGNTFRTADFRGIRIVAGAFGPDTEKDTGITARFNNFVDNTEEGLRVDADSYTGTLDAECNWWGDATGPAISTNPAGVGDGIFDPETHVDFTPWLGSSLPDPCSGPVHLDINSDTTIDVNFGAIQPAVTTGGDGDTVLVDPGTYTEQVVIDAGIRLLPTVPGTHPTIRAPPFASRTTFTIPSSGRTWDAIVEIRADDASIEGFNIDGFGRGGFCSGRSFTGIMMHGGLDMRAERNHVTGIRDTPFSGCQAGLGIVVYPDTEGIATSAEIALNTIDDYQKGGIVVNIEGATADVRDNVVEGVGPTDVIAQNGIQFGFGAGGSATGNDVRGHTYTGGFWTSAGILLFEADDGVVVSGNNLLDNQAGIYAFDSDSADISANVLTGSALGIVSEGSAGVSIEGNELGVPMAVPNQNEIIGIWAIASTDVSVMDNVLEFGGAVDPVPTLYGISFEDSSGLIDGNDVIGVSMPPGFFGLQTGVGIVVTGTGAVDILDNDIESYQKGGIVVGRIGNGLGNDPVDAFIFRNTVIGVGPTDLIAQNGIQVADTASGIVAENFVSGNTYTGGFWTATGILAYSAGSGLEVVGNVLTDNQVGVYLFDTDGAVVRENAIGGSALGIVVDTSDDAVVWANAIHDPAVVPNEDEVIGIWVIDSARTTVSGNELDFGGAVSRVARLEGISFEDSSGTIRDNLVRGVRMAGADFALLTGIGIVATGHGDLRIEENTVQNYQWGGIFVGLPDSPYSGHIDVVKNYVRGVGPTEVIRQIGVLISGPGVSGDVRRNFIADNCFIGSQHDRNDHDDDDDDDHDERDHDDDRDGKHGCRGESDVKDKDKKTCPPGVAVGLLLCNVDRHALEVKKNDFRGNQVDILRVRT